MLKVQDAKFTGMSRRIDSLGRVVIPKEIRSTLALGEGDMMEIHVLGNIVGFKKRDPDYDVDMALSLLSDPGG